VWTWHHWMMVEVARARARVDMRVVRRNRASKRNTQEEEGEMSMNGTLDEPSQGMGRGEGLCGRVDIGKRKSVCLHEYPLARGKTRRERLGWDSRHRPNENCASSPARCRCPLPPVQSSACPGTSTFHEWGKGRCVSGFLLVRPCQQRRSVPCGARKYRPGRAGGPFPSLRRHSATARLVFGPRGKGIRPA
jgi:hypothetical protein